LLHSMREFVAVLKPTKPNSHFRTTRGLLVMVM
jgi:hypothetical protein